MSDKDDGLVAKMLPDGVAEDVVCNLGIEGAERVIQDVNVPIAVEGPGQADSLALPTTQVGATLSNLMDTGKYLEAGRDRTSLHHTSPQKGSDVTSVRSAAGSRVRSGLRQQALNTD